MRLTVVTSKECSQLTLGGSGDNADVSEADAASGIRCLEQPRQQPSELPVAALAQNLGHLGSSRGSTPRPFA
jgi:hypothetical protein